MNLPGLRYAAGCVAFVVLAGCAGPALQSGVPATGPQRAVDSMHLAAGGSWMAAEAKSEDLLYVTNVRAQAVDVYAYPQGKLVGKLTGFGQPRSECADGAGDVWIADAGGFDVIEYPHAGVKPIVALNTAGSPQGCSVDPVTGNLAITGGTNGIVLSVFRHTVHGGWQGPAKYTATNMRGEFCGYDSQGNLFFDEQSGKGAFHFAELPRHAKALKAIALNHKIVAAGQVQWDGRYVAVGDAAASPSVLYRFSISGGVGTEAGSTTLANTTTVRQFWIQGSTVVAPDLSGHDVGLFNYPAGGSPVNTITGVAAYGATVSLAQAR